MTETTPWIEGSFFASATAETEESDGERIWQDVPHIKRHGDWRPEELRVAAHVLGRAVIFGSCLADDETIQATLAHALEKNDPKVLGTMPGSYTTMLFRPNEVTVLADLANQFPLFYKKDDNNVQFSSKTKPLGDTCRLDVDPLTLALQIGTPWSSELLAGRSTMQGVERLESARMLQVDREGRSKEGLYEPFELSFGDMHEAADALREALIDAAKLRTSLGRRMSVDFSGGLDSTSLAYLIANEHDDPLLIATRHSQDTPLDDLGYVKQYLGMKESQGRFDWHEFEQPGSMMIYHDLLGVPQVDGPDVSIADRASDIAYYKFLRELGSELHVTGNGADGVVDLDPREYLGELAHVGTYQTFIRSILEVARTERTSPLKVYRQSMNPTAGAIDGLSMGIGTAPEWLTTNLRREIADLIASKHDQARIHKDNSGNYAAYSQVRALGMALHGSMQVAALYGISESAPYMDNGVLRACLGLPAHKRMNPWEFKMMLHTALKDVIPSTITQRRTKGDYTRHAYQGLRAAAPVFEQLLDNSRLADLGIIEPGKVRETLNQGYAGANFPWVSFDGLIAAELWLRSLESESKVTSSSVSKVATDETHRVEVPLPSVPDNAIFRMPKAVTMITRPTGGIALNVASGTYHRLNVPAQRIVEALRDGADFGEAMQLLSALYPGIDESHIRAKSTECITALSNQGILEDGEGGFSILPENDSDAGTLPSVMVRESTERIHSTGRQKVRALGGFVAALAMKKLPFSDQVSILRTLHEDWCPDYATPEDARSTLAAVHKISKLYLGRAACLELSMSTALAAALQRRRVDMVLGVRSDPDSFHAWPEVNGEPIRTAQDELVTGMYRRLLRV